MYDPRLRQLADVLIDHSTKLKKGETIYIETFDIPVEMVETLVQKVYEVGGIPIVSQKFAKVLRKLYMDADEATMKTIGELELATMKKADAYIGLRGSHNITETSDVPPEKMELYKKHWWGPVHIEWRVPKTRWVVLRWPTSSMAQQAQMSTQAFEKFYFDTCTMDYTKMSQAMDPLKELMERTEKVRIIAPGTDLTFSIKDIPVIKCDGELNIPDGEIFTAPVKDSVNGTLAYNTQTLYDGKVFSSVKLEFKKDMLESSARVSPDRSCLVPSAYGTASNERKTLSASVPQGCLGSW